MSAPIVWTCKIGGDVDPRGPRAADPPMRDAVEAAYRKLTGRDAEFTFSGWGDQLTESELAVVEDRELDPGRVRVELLEHARRAFPDPDVAARVVRAIIAAATGDHAVSDDEPGPASGTIRLVFRVEAQVALSRVTAGWTDAEARALLDGDVDALEGAVAVILDRYRDELRFDVEHTAVHGRMADELPPEATA